MAQFNSRDEHWMHEALKLAKQAQHNAEVPVGAIVVANDEIIGVGWNQPIMQHDPTAHAEIIAIREAAKAVGNYRLPNTTLYVTLEPCAMCAGAMVHARIQRLVFGAFDSRSGAASSVFNILEPGKLNHDIEVVGGLLAEEAKTLLQDFFRAKR